VNYVSWKVKLMVITVRYMKEGWMDGIMEEKIE
jgi:hypothetical protein